MLNRITKRTIDCIRYHKLVCVYRKRTCWKFWYGRGGFVTLGIFWFLYLSYIGSCKVYVNKSSVVYLFPDFDFSRLHKPCDSGSCIVFFRRKPLLLRARSTNNDFSQVGYIIFSWVKIILMPLATSNDTSSSHAIPSSIDPPFLPYIPVPLPPSLPLIIPSSISSCHSLLSRPFSWMILRIPPLLLLHAVSTTIL